MEVKTYNRLKIVLAEKRMPNKEFAQKLGVTETTVARWTNNRQQPDVPMLFKIAALLERDVCDLLDKTQTAETAAADVSAATEKAE